MRAAGVFFGLLAVGVSLTACGGSDGPATVSATSPSSSTSMTSSTSTELQATVDWSLTDEVTLDGTTVRLRRSDAEAGQRCALVQTKDAAGAWQPAQDPVLPSDRRDDTPDELIASCVGRSVLEREGAWFFQPLSTSGGDWFGGVLLDGVSDVTIDGSLADLRRVGEAGVFLKVPEGAGSTGEGIDCTRDGSTAACKVL